MKCHATCCVCQYYTSTSCPCTSKFETAGWRLHVSGLDKKIWETCIGKHFLLLKKKITIRNRLSVKLFPLSFHLSTFEVTFIKTSNQAICWQKEFVCSLNIVHKWCSLIDPFPANHCSAFFYSCSFSYALYSDDSFLFEKPFFFWKRFYLQKNFFFV